MGAVVSLGYFDQVGPADPCGGPIEEFRSSLEQISRCRDALAAKIILTECQVFRGRCCEGQAGTGMTPGGAQAIVLPFSTSSGSCWAGRMISI